MRRIHWFTVFLLLFAVSVVSGCASKKSGGVPIVSTASQQRTQFESRLATVEENLSHITGDEEDITSATIDAPEVDQPSSKRVVTIIVVHHTAGSQGSDAERIIPAFSRLHSRRFNTMPSSLGMTVAYHYIIMADGAIHQTRDEGDIGYHAGDWEVNKTSIGICLTGNLEQHKPTVAQIESLDRLVRRLQGERNIVKIFPHSHCRATLCCGENLKAEIRKLPWGEHF